MFFDDKKNDYLYNKIISQVVDNMREPLNKILAFSSVIWIDETISPEIKEFIKSIHLNGLELEHMVSNIDSFFKDKDDIEEINFDICELVRTFSKRENRALNSKSISLKLYLEKDNITVSFSKDLISKILENLIIFSTVRMLSTKNKEITIIVKTDKKNIKLYYMDTGTPVYIEKGFFTLDDLTKINCGLELRFIEKFVKMYSGTINYFYGKEWQKEVSEANILTKTQHGFKIKLPIMVENSSTK